MVFHVMMYWHTDDNHPDSKVHGANMGPIWGRQDPGGPHVGPMKLLSGYVEHFSTIEHIDIKSKWLLSLKWMQNAEGFHLNPFLRVTKWRMD